MKKSVAWKRSVAISACALLLGATAAGGFATLPAGAASGNHYTVDLEKQLQEFDGWGLSLSWWATEIGDWTRQGASGKQKREEIAEALYGKSGLDLNIARYNVGGGDDPEHIHMSDDRNTPGWRNATKTSYTAADGKEYPLYAVDDKYVFEGENGEILDWTQVPDHRQLWVLDWIQNNPDRAEDYISEYYSNSPPYWMTISGCSSGGAGGWQNLEYNNNQAFVDYFLDVYEYLTAQGFRLDNLQPFNESGSTFWGTNGDQEGCYFSAEQKVLVLDLLRKEMEERGLSVPYNWGDETNTSVAYDQYAAALGTVKSDGQGGAIRGEEIVHGADRYTYHIYWYDKSGVQRMYRTAKADGKQLYMSEICWSDPADDGEAKYDASSLTTGFHYTQSIIDTVKHGGVDAYVFWQGMEDMVGQMKGGTNYGLIQGVYYTQEEAEAQGVDLASMGLTYQDYVLSKAYYMSGQYTKWIKQGYTIVDVNEDNTLAALSPDGQTLVIVKQNNSASGENFTLDLNGFYATSAEKVYTDKTHSWAHERLSAGGNSVSDSVSPRSVTTYILHGSKTAGEGHFADDSVFSRSGGTLAEVAAKFEESDSEQFYTDMYTGGGNAYFYGDTLTNWTQNASNGNGKYVAFKFYGTGFALTSPKKDDMGKFDLYLDCAPEGEAKEAVELYSAKSVASNIVYTKKGLEEGWHTVYLVSAAQEGDRKWTNFDGVFLYTSEGKTEEGQFLITGAAGAEGKVVYSYLSDAIDGKYEIFAEVYENGGWVRRDSEEEYAENGTGTLFAEGEKVRMRLVAVYGEECIYSPERILNMLKTNKDVLYFVDCATSDPYTLRTGAVLGTAQSVSDQPYGADLHSGLNWGYTGSYTAYCEGDEAMSSIWSLDGSEQDAIQYTFTIPEAGNYKVALGFFGGSDAGWGERAVKATVGTQQQEATLKGTEYTALYFDVTTRAAEETLTVSVARKDDKQNSSHLSLIVITAADKKVPLYTDSPSTLNSYAGATETITVGDDLYAKLNQSSFKLFCSDGTNSTLPASDAAISVQTTSIALNQRATANFLFEEEGITVYKGYRWTQAGGVQLYYNIDCGYMGDGTPPDDGTELGSKQSTTHDREFGEDSSAPNKESWGYVGSHFNDGINWKDDKENKWSIREGLDGDSGKKEASYKMTGFEREEPLTVEVAGHCSNWGTRTFSVLVNGVEVGTVELKSNENPVAVTFTGEEVKADEKGELVVKCQQKSGDGAQVGYIKVYSTGAAYPKDDQITADSTVVARDGKVTLGALNTQGTVYVLDENNIMVGSFKPTKESMELNIADYLPKTSNELHLLQAAPDLTNASKELVLTVDELGLDVIQSEGFVKDGDAAVIRFVPHTAHGVTSLTLTTPGGVRVDVTDGFFYRAKVNGKYSVTLLSGGVSVTKEFEVKEVDTVSFNPTYSTTNWTNGPVTLTFKPTAVSGVERVVIDGAPATATKEGGEDCYTLVAQENGAHTVKVCTMAGFEYEETFEVTNIDRSTPQVSYKLDYAKGICLHYTAQSASAGKLYVTFNGTEKEVTELSALPLVEAGKYEFCYKSETGAESEKAVYYLSYGVENAALADISLAEDGTVTLSAKARAELSATLCRAGESTPIGSMKAEKAGRYYLQVESGGETEIVVFNLSAEGSEQESGCGALINANGVMLICCITLFAAAFACTSFTKKGRKNS